MESITEEERKTLIVNSALQKKSRLQLSKEVGISEFTLRKVLDADSSVEVSNKTANLVRNWLKKNIL
ncbi:hypothetical protein [Lentilactobacillus sp. SPB1-3]|uniref:Uncharacterized protein n=1 Tax=Lentilactobacillus terminaliae TaxID=3003483 RepID=A0ACD5DDK2_9LACO|nr:hypothetical protein [Lentilactobacillus sp. SPB1-3]MCZ0978072.1 hypothetical protein [Lentilactobacillus sp. SPB1-3]